MAVWSRDGKTLHSDVRDQRIAAGTVGGEHAVPESFDGRRFTSIISLFDPRVSFSGTWNAQVGLEANDFLGEQALGTAPGSTVTLQFSGTSISVIGRTVNYGGRADVYVDGVLQGGRLNTFSYLHTGHKSGLNATDTSVPVGSATDFSASGEIQIDGEIITYTSKNATDLLGCTRGASGSQATTHTEGTTVYQYSSLIEGYAAYQQPRVVMWSSNQLTPGLHTLELVVRSDAAPASSATTLYLNGFVVGGTVGAPNIITHLDTFEAPSVAINSFGYSTLSYTMTTQTTDQQVIGVIGATAYVAGVAYWCGISVDPTTGALGFYVPAATSSTADIIVTVTVLGAPL